MTWLGVINFIVLQWFGVRLARVVARDQILELLREWGDITEAQYLRHATVGWRVLRWVWPLTGWWSDYRWIMRRT